MARLRLVMCAGVVPTELHGELGRTRSGLIPLAGKSLLQKHLEVAGAIEMDLLVAVDAEDERTKRYCELLEIPYRLVDGSLKLGSAVQFVLRSLEDEKLLAGPFELLFGDTVSFDLLPADAIGVVQVPDAAEWTQVSIEQDSLVFSDGGATGTSTLAGLFSFSNPSGLLKLLETGLDLWTALTRYHQDINNLTLVQLDSWFDFGRIDTLFSSRQLSFNARHFNEVQYLAKRGTIRKSSIPEKRQKIVDEAVWYESLRYEQRCLTPAVREVNLVEGYYELDYLPTPTVAETLLFSAMRIGYWERFFSSLGEFLGKLHAEPSVSVGEVASSQALEHMYVDKISHRFEQMIDDIPRLKEFEFHIDGSRKLSLQQGIDAVLSWGQSQDSQESGPFRFIHGDLFLGNMFFDRRLGLVRAIDPRGSFGALFGQGDQRYDLGKLAHSLFSGYDLLAAGLFRITSHGSSIEIETGTSVVLRPIRRLVEDAFEGYCGQTKANLSDVRMIEAGLFLSMVPLHADSPERQLALIGTGLQVLADLEVI